MVRRSQPPSLDSVHSQTVQTLHQSIPEELWPSSLRTRLISTCVLSVRISFPCRLCRSSSCPLRMTAELVENQPKEGWWRKGSRGMNMQSVFFFSLSFGRWCYGRKRKISYDQICVTHTHLQCFSALYLHTVLDWKNSSDLPLQVKRHSSAARCKSGSESHSVLWCTSLCGSA